jgi:hypothetical protein
MLGGANGNASVGYFPRDAPSILVPLCPGGRFKPSRGPNMRLAATRAAPMDFFALNSMTITAVHEFGHVLGLGHELHRCAVMYPDSGRATCAQPAEPWEYRCRTLEPDDVAGAVRLYGGRVRPSTGPAFCAHPPPEAPTEVSAAADTVANAIRVHWRNPTGSWLDEVAIAAAVDRCPSPEEAEAFEPRPIRGALQELLVYWPSPGVGHVCVSVFARDLFGRYSEPATTWLDSP